MTIRERPILFSGPMVRAILDGRKTQTRRVVKPQPTSREQMRGFRLDWLDHGVEPDRQRYGITSSVVDGAEIVCPYGGPGQRLWVRETWGRIEAMSTDIRDSLVYRADGDTPAMAGYWRPSIHMPRWASRITLEIEAVWCERVQDITEANAMAEGVERIELGPHEIAGLPVHPMTSSYAAAFATLWDSINGTKYPWASNPWIWAITFKRIERTNA